MNYIKYEMNIVIFGVNEDLVRTLSGDEDGSGGSSGSSTWSIRPDRSDA